MLLYKLYKVCGSTLSAQVWLCLAEIVMLFQPLMHSKNQIVLANNLVSTPTECTFQSTLCARVWGVHVGSREGEGI